MSKGEEMLPSLEAIARELDRFRKISSGTALKVEILAVTKLLKKYVNNKDEVQAVKEAVSRIREAMKELQEAEAESGKTQKALGAEERLEKVRLFWNKTVMKPLCKKVKDERKRAKMERSGSN